MAAELKARLTLNNSQFLRTLRGSLVEGRRFGSELASRGFAVARTGLLALAAAAAVSGGALAVGVKSAYDLGGSLSDLSTRTGITAGRLLVMQRAFVDNGLAADEVGNAVNRMQRFLVAASEGGVEAQRTMAAMNLTLEDFAGLTPDKQFEMVSAAINGIQDASLRADTAMAIFGRSGAKLLTLFADRGGMATAGRVLGRQAEILDQRANEFDAISDKLGRAGTKLQGFFVGVAASLAGTIGPLLDRFEAFDFATIGEKFGNSLLTGADALLGAFRDPEAALGGLKNYAVGAMAEAGNRLMQSLSAALAFFRDGFGDSIQGLGRLLLGTLLDVFANSTAEFQARAQQTLALLEPMNAADAATYRNIDASILPYQRKRLQEAATRGDAAEVADAQREIAAATRLADEIIARQAGGSIEDRKAAILANGGPRINMGAEGALSSADLIASGRAMLGRGVAAGGRAASAAPYQDIFGSAQAFAAAERARSSLAASGAGIRAAATTAAAPQGPRTGYEAQLYGLYGSARAQQLIAERSAVAAPRDPSAAKSLNVQERVLTELQKLTSTMEEAFAN